MAMNNLEVISGGSREKSMASGTKSESESLRTSLVEWTPLITLVGVFIATVTVVSIIFGGMISDINSNIRSLNENILSINENIGEIKAKVARLDERTTVSSVIVTRLYLS